MSWLQATFCLFFLTTFYWLIFNFYQLLGVYFFIPWFFIFCNLTTFMGSFVAFTWSESLNFWIFLSRFSVFMMFFCVWEIFPQGGKKCGVIRFSFIFNFMNYKMWLLKCQAMITKMQKTIDQPTVNTKEYPSRGNNWG